MSGRHALAALLVLLPSGAALAQDRGETVVLPSELAEQADREMFRRCRIAAFYEQEAVQKSDLPPENVTALREQIDFIMADTLFNLPALNMADGAKRLGFMEEWTIDFSREIGSSRAQMRDPEQRAAILGECQPYIWNILKVHIEALLRWRAEAMNTDAVPQVYKAD